MNEAVKALAVGIGLFVAALAHPALGEDRGARIRAFGQSWIGTPYVWGGTGREGIDCSGYLREMYRALFAIELPRTTRQQIELGADLALNPREPSQGLEPGDVIFYIDRVGVPSHVVTYAGLELITHSESGRGVVIEPIDRIFGRRVVARRFLVPRSGGGGYEAIPPAGPIVIKEIPCPPRFKAKAIEVRKLAKSPIADLKLYADREICELKVLDQALRENGSAVGRDNAVKLDTVVEWLENVDNAKSLLDGGR